MAAQFGQERIGELACALVEVFADSDSRRPLVRVQLNFLKEPVGNQLWRKKGGEEERFEISLTYAHTLPERINKNL